jgi:serine/threonine protein phosphatase 1
MRWLVIGDIHGALKALIQCLTRSNYDPAKDGIIFLGDYTDGWSESAQVVEYLINLKKENNNIIFIRGNHDMWMHEWLISGKANNIWLVHGGKESVESYISSGLLVSDAHKEFFMSLVPYYITGDNKAFMHGGFTSRKGVGHEKRESNYYWDRNMWSLAMYAHDNKIDVTPRKYRFLKHKEVYIGHTPTINYINDDNTDIIDVPMNKCNVWNMDTGCGWNGKLTAMDIETKEIYQSDNVCTLYPNEKGRN